MSSFRFSSYADEDIESIFRYTIRKWGFDQADTYYELLASARDCIVQIHTSPEAKPEKISR